MYHDEYYPDFLVDKVKKELQKVIDLLESGERVIQQTRRWMIVREKARPCALKRMTQDYKYFPEPDLPPISISDEEVERVRASLPELPEQKKKALYGGAWPFGLRYGYDYRLRLFCAAV